MVLLSVFLHSWCIVVRRLARWDVVEFKTFSTFQAQGNMQTLLVPASHHLHSYEFCVLTRSYVNVGSASFENWMGHWSKFLTPLFVAVLYSVLLLLGSHLSLFLECPEPWFICKAWKKGIWKMDENIGKGCPSHTSRELLQRYRACYGT